MNILLLFPFEDGETAVAIKEAFEHHGHSVCGVDAKITPELSFTEFRKGDFDFVLCSRTIELYEQIVRIKKHKNVPIACWNMDTREDLMEWGPLLHMFEYVDYYFTIGEDYEQHLKHGITAHHLKQGLHDRRYYPVSPTMNQYNKYASETGFIGNIIEGLHKSRLELLQAINDNFQFKSINGVYGPEHSAAVGSIKVNICDSMNSHIKNSFSVRNWKVIGAEGVLIERYREGIEDYYNGFVESYKTNEEAVSKVKWILGSYDRYKKIAKKARRWALSSQTYKIRIKQMLKVVFG